ncbi:hypothetical protein [Umezawaea sp. Da 62-37]|uniref:hypothetical protein n=1 Tax=Umezawaea sp. Da 62-37 TaxID=3075927 RepID=UPI0028F6D0D2|nr:hypothetical protein [Umezawaea sp. Da 62-37]WNV90518.1 hypothetical protein RM788_20210 [Umezawaea sp. Da 62-37]
MEEALRKAVMQRLALLDKAAELGEAESLVPLARAEIHRLADGWRLLLTVHQPDEDSRCRACPGWLRRRRWPCQIWTMAHQHLIGEGVAHRDRRRPLRNPFTRSGAVGPTSGATSVEEPAFPTIEYDDPEHHPAEDGVPAESPAERTTELPAVPGMAEPGVHRAPVVGRPRHALPD